MAAARRLYVYGVSAISLLVLAMGLIQLLTVALGQVADALGAAVLSGDEATNLDQLSLAIALVVVGLPIWAVHWWLAERSVTGHGPAATAERQSTIRAVHFLDVELVSLVAWLIASISLLGWIMRTILGAGDGFGPRPTDWIAILAIAAPIWAYHAMLRDRDLRAARLIHGAAWVSRLYRHAGAFIGLVLAGFGAADAIATLLAVLVGRPVFGGATDWWHWPLADALARLIAGSIVLGLHWLDIDRTIRDADRIGEDERWTRVRRTYFAAAVVTAAVAVLFALESSLASVATWLLGVAEPNDVATLAEDVIGPPLAVIPWLLAGAWHLRSSVREGAALDAATGRSAERVDGHLLSLVGLAAAAGGLARLLGLLLEATIGRPGLVSDDVWRLDLAQGVAFAVVGAALWLWQWLAMLGAWSRVDAERATTASRSYLYLAVGGGLLAAVPSVALILYRMLNVVLATDPGASLGDEIATPLGVAVIAALVAAYHGRILLADLRRAPALAPATAAAGEGAAITAAGEGAAITVVVRGPAGTDMDAVLAELRGRLPTGVTIETGPLTSPPGGGA